MIDTSAILDKLVIRDFTEAEMTWWRQGMWPCCGGKEYESGPRGGPCMNITCPACGTKANVMDPEIGIREFEQMVREPLGYIPPMMAPDVTVKTMLPTPSFWARCGKWLLGILPKSKGEWK